jgi:hypothetical protein
MDGGSGSRETIAEWSGAAGYWSRPAWSLDGSFIAADLPPEAHLVAFDVKTHRRELLIKSTSREPNIGLPSGPSLVPEWIEPPRPRLADLATPAIRIRGSCRFCARLRARGAKIFREALREHGRQRPVPHRAI